MEKGIDREIWIATLSEISKKVDDLEAKVSELKERNKFRSADDSKQPIEGSEEVFRDDGPKNELWVKNYLPLFEATKTNEGKLAIIKEFIKAMRQNQERYGLISVKKEKEITKYLAEIYGVQIGKTKTKRYLK